MFDKQPMFNVPLQAMGPIRLWSTWDPEQYDLTKQVPEFVRDMPKAYRNFPGHAPSMPCNEPRSPVGTPGGLDVLVASVGASAAGGVRGTQNGQGERTESVPNEPRSLVGAPGGLDVLVASVEASSAGGVRGPQNGRIEGESMHDTDNSQGVVNFLDND